MIRITIIVILLSMLTSCRILDSTSSESTGLPQSTSTSVVYPTITFTSTEDRLADLLSLSSRLRYIFIDYENHLWFWDGNSLRDMMVLPEYVLQELTQLSPNGEYLVVSIGNPSHPCPSIYLVELSSGEMQLLISESEIKAVAPNCADYLPIGLRFYGYQIAWFPDSQRFLINIGNLGDIYLVDINDKTYERILSLGEIGKMSLSPDGEKVAIKTTHSSFLYKLKDMQQIAFMEFEPFTPFEGIPYFVRTFWDQGSQKFVLILPPPDRSIEENPTTLWYLSEDDPSPKILASILGSEEIDVSPDLRWIVYCVRSGSECEYHLLNVHEGKDIIFYSGQSSFERWLPNSNQFIFFMSGKKPWRFLVTISEGEVIFTPICNFPDWIEGEAFICANSNDPNYFIQDLDGNSIELFTSTGSFYHREYIILP